MPSGSKPGNATYVGKAVINFATGEAEIKYAEDAARDHRFCNLEVALYRDENRDRTIVKFDGASPSLLRQAYQTGKGDDVIIEYVSDGK